jgi:nucleoside-diphosphate-sugar epimerase
MKVCVTGASGKAGRAVVTDLREQGHHVVAVDVRAPLSGAAGSGMVHADLTDYG